MSQLAAMFANLIVQFFFRTVRFIKEKNILLLTWVLVLFVSCSNQPAQKQFRVGFSQCLSSDDWRKTMLAEMQRELSFNNNIEFLFRDANAVSASKSARLKNW